jgi:chaperone modulatory protein CbpM
MENHTFTGILLDEQIVSVQEICDACSCHQEWIIELVDQGILEPVDPPPDEWRFTGISLTRAQMAKRLQRDLGINLAGVALALQLLDEIALLRRQRRV